VEQNAGDDIINTHEKEKRNLEEELSGINLTQNI
jgi:hypothetical protein